MIPEVGQLALILALLLAAAQATLPVIGAWKRIPAFMAIARPVAQGLFVFIATAFGCLMYSFVTNDFSVTNVASNSNSALPLHYRVAATWGSHEGSILLWVLMLTVWSTAVSLRSKHLPQEMVARVLGVMGMVTFGFVLFMVTTSNPFDRTFPVPQEGHDLNPLLQDPGMVMHPPMLYMGYVGFSIAFSFAIAALLGGRLDATWARWSRPWTTLAWCFLTIGIMIGSWWSYYVLGWGGWWFWDPVENASFMPWLVGTALLHSLAVTEKRGTFKMWTALLAICAFSLSLMGTFLVRSGVLTSVHAFATDPRRGIFILAFLAVVIGGSLTLFAVRAPKVGIGGKFDLVSRESMLLGNNVLLLVAAGSVLLGTLYPLFLDALNLSKISVGPPYFDAVFVPLMTPLVFLMGVGPVARWKHASLPELWILLRWALGVAIVAGVLTTLLAGRTSPMLVLGYSLAFWVIATTFVNLRERLSNASGSLLSRVAKQPRGWWGMLIAHLGIAVFIIGVTSVKGFEVERDVRMSPGDSIEVGGYTFLFKGTTNVTGPNYNAARGYFEVSRDGKLLETMRPEKRKYFSSEMLMTDAAISPGVFGDRYVSLGEEAGDSGAWSVRVYSKPFVTWIWFGCIIMALGGFTALTDRRYRLRERSSATVPAGSAPASA